MRVAILRFYIDINSCNYESTVGPTKTWFIHHQNFELVPQQTPLILVVMVGSHDLLVLSHILKFRTGTPPTSSGSGASSRPPYNSDIQVVLKKNRNKKCIQVDH